MLEQKQSPGTVFQDLFPEEVWKSTYKDYKDLSVNDTLRRVAKTIASAELTQELRQIWEERFYDLLSEFKGVSGGRITANAGTEWAGTTFMNCYVGPLPDQDLDSIEGIYRVLLDQAQTLKSEGGWGMNFSWIRPRGAFIDGIGVESPGSVRFMEIFDKSSEIVTAGSGKKAKNAKAKEKIRKGAMMGVLDVWHPDIVEFITAKQTGNRLSKFNLSVNCTDEFMTKVKLVKHITETDSGLEGFERLEQADRWELVFPDTKHIAYKSEWKGDIKSWKAKGYPVVVHSTISVSWLWNLITESTYNRNEPGVLFLDRANEFAPLNYAETILATNPSMPAGTLVHTKDGIFPIDFLQDQKFEVKSLDGTWAPAKCFLSGESEPILEFKVGNHKYLRSTKQHRWPVYDQRMGRIYKVYASDLKVGDLIPLNRNEPIGIFGDMSLTRDEGLFLGYLVGDGWFNSRKDTGVISGGITFGKHERVMAEKILSIANTLTSGKFTLSERSSELYFQFGNKEMSDLLVNRYGVIPGVKNIPSSIWTSNDNFIEGFIDGLLSSDGSVYVSEKNQSIQLTTSRRTLAEEFAKLLSFAGISSSIYDTTIKNPSFPNGKDYNKEYTRWDVKISGGNLVNFCNVFSISHPDKSEKLSENLRYLLDTRYQRSREFIEIESIGEKPPEKVWDISVYHDQHVFPSEWCYTGNCGEQTLAPGGVCCLGTINLTQFIDESREGFDLDKLTKYVGYLVRFLDNVNTISDAPLPEYKHSMEKKRRIGCGVMGWGSALFMLKIRFGSERAAELREQVMSTYARAAYMASIDLAEEKGMFEYCEPAKHAEGKFVQSLGLSPIYMDKLRITGIRNSSLLSQQPNGNGSIFANVVTGGIEPAFLVEYIRTVICNFIPDSIAGVTPNYKSGEFVETSLFKFVKEGDEEILRGVGPDGITYKIDKNRGLTKEVLCEDFGVRFLKANGEWDPTADYVVTTAELTVTDHVEDLRGFARWTDSACSKTCNIPNDYSYEDFKNLYLDVYNTGVIKGFTTYRAGTMTSVLSAVKETIDVEEEIILEDIKLPDSLPATMKTLRSEKRKWYLMVVLNESQTKPLAIFNHTNHAEKTVTATDALDHLLKLAIEKGIPQKHIEAVVAKAANDTNTTKICRMIGLCLRHGVLIRNVVAALEQVECIAGSFVFHIRKYLASFIKDGEKVTGARCEECNSDQVVYQEGCRTCKNCGSSKCG